MVVIDVEATGKKIHKMVRAKYKIRQFGELLGLTSTSVMYHWFHGESLPHIERIFQIADLLDCSVEDIIVIRRI